jgi:hypothetical protein
MSSSGFPAAPRLLLLAVLAGAAAAVSVPARADPITREGITFSDELGNFKLISVTGKGSLNDPFVLREEVTGPDDPVLVIRGFSRDFGNRAGTQHTTAFAMTKIVVNKMSKAWAGYQVELREVETRHSTYQDGLSFGQGSQVADDYVKSSLPHSQRLDEPEDSLGFGGENIPPGAEASFSFIISDMSPIDKFYLVQRPLQPLSELATPPGPRFASR